MASSLESILSLEMTSPLARFSRSPPLIRFSRAVLAPPPISSLGPLRLRNMAVVKISHCLADSPHELATDSAIASKVSWNPRVVPEEELVAMVEGEILVLYDAEDSLAETRLALAEAFKYGICPILLLNKVDTSSVSESKVSSLYANHDAIDDSKEGWTSATYTKEPPTDNDDYAKYMSELLDKIIRIIPPPTASIDAPFQLLIPIMEKDSNLGRKRVTWIIVCVGDRVDGICGVESGMQKTEEGKVVMLKKKKDMSRCLPDLASHRVHGVEVSQLLAFSAESDSGWIKRFETWMQKHKREYKDQKEYEIRFAVYRKKAERIDHMNSQNLGYSARDGQFTDMTDEEMKLMFPKMN